MASLTKRALDALQPDPSGRDRFLWDSGDGAIKGFGVRMKPSGSAAFLVQYRNQEGRTRRLVIGKLGVLTPSEARALAAEKLAEAAKGGDPSAERRALRKAMTVQELAEWYLQVSAAHIKPSTWAMDRSRINCHVIPLLGARVVAGLTLTDIERFQSDIASGKTALPRKKNGRAGKLSGGRGVASRCVGMLGTMLEFAKRNGIIEQNPARGVRRFPDEKRRRYLSIDELNTLGMRINAAIERSESLTPLSAVRALLLTGCRRVEILSLKPEHVDVEAQCIRFEDTKSGPQVRPVGKTAIELLKSQRVLGSSKWIFPADRGDGHFVGLPRVLKRLCQGSGLSDISVHTLRHTFAAIAASMGYSELTIAGLLGHQVSGITARYAHVPDQALITAADSISAKISEALNVHRVIGSKPINSDAALTYEK